MAIDSVITGVKNKPLFKEIEKELRVTLSGQAHYFMVSTKSDFSFITSKIKKGDSVTIYYNLPFPYWLSGTRWRIYQLQKNEQVILSFDEYKKTTYFPLLILIISVFGFGGYYLYWRMTSSL